MPPLTPAERMAIMAEVDEEIGSSGYRYDLSVGKLNVGQRFGSYLWTGTLWINHLNLEDLRTTREKYQDFAEPDNSDKSFGLSSANALALPFADHTFDRVICSEVLEHIPDYRAALVEIERVLKPGGLLCATVPRCWPERICWWFSSSYHLVPGGHLRIFHAGELRSQIEELLLSIKDKHPQWSMPGLGVNFSEDLFSSLRKAGMHGPLWQHLRPRRKTKSSSAVQL